MAKFACIYKTNENDENFDETSAMDLIKKHIEYLRNMKHKGVLFLCGILSGKTGLKENQGALIILETKSYEEAEAHILQDPLVINKWYSYTIKEFIEGNEANNYLLDG